MPRGDESGHRGPGGAAYAPTDGTAAAVAGQDRESVDDRDLRPGDAIDEYRIDARIGEGGFGTVFKATHSVIGSVAAIKVLKRKYSSEPSVVSRFIAEARAVNEIRHQNIIDIFSFGKLADGRQYYVMEFLDGTALDELLRRRGRFTLADALPILRGIAQALDAAHARGVIHRDLKPANVLVAGEQVRLLDFGVAKLSTIETGHDTATGTPIGTPRYMSPEQARGRRVDHRSDVYSFGVLIYELLTGVTPFAGDDFMEVVLKQIHDPPPPPSSRCAQVPARLDASVLAILAKQPAERPASATAALLGVERAAGAQPSAGEVAAPGGAPRRWWLLAALVAGTIIAGAIHVASRSAPPDRPPAAANPPVAAPDRADPAPAPPPTPPPIETVVVEVRDLQPEARIIRADGTLVRVGPGTFELPRSSEPVELRFEGTGYEPQTRTVRPDKATILVLHLAPQRKAKPPPSTARPTKDDIVDTF